MADNLTDAEERRLLDLSLPDDNVWLALFTVAPAEDGTGGTEVSGGSYARQPISFAAASTTGGNTTKANDAVLTYPAASAAWGQIVAYGVMDASTAGNMRWRRTLSTSGPDERRTVNSGDQYRVGSGALVFALS